MFIVDKAREGYISLCIAIIFEYNLTQILLSNSCSSICVALGFLDRYFQGASPRDASASALRCDVTGHDATYMYIYIYIYVCVYIYIYIYVLEPSPPYSPACLASWLSIQASFQARSFSGSSLFRFASSFSYWCSYFVSFSCLSIFIVVFFFSFFLFVSFCSCFLFILLCLLVSFQFIISFRYLRYVLVLRLPRRSVRRRSCPAPKNPNKTMNI